MFQIDKSKCLECGACADVCTMRVFYRDDAGKTAVKDRRCMQCFHCAAVCPAQAVSADGLSPAQFYAQPPEDPLAHSIMARRSVRRFKPDLPERALLQRALDTAMYAPSGKNEHANRWTVVLGKERTDELYRMTLDWAGDQPGCRHLLKLAKWGVNPVTCGAPCLIVGWNRTDALNPQSDTVIAMTLAEQLLVREGLGTCWAGYLRTAAQESADIRAYLGIPEGGRVYEILLAGFPVLRYPNLPGRPAAEIRWVE